MPGVGEGSTSRPPSGILIELRKRVVRGDFFWLRLKIFIVIWQIVDEAAKLPCQKIDSALKTTNASGASPSRYGTYSSAARQRTLLTLYRKAI